MQPPGTRVPLKGQKGSSPYIKKLPSRLDHAMAKPWRQLLAAIVLLASSAHALRPVPRQIPALKSHSAAPPRARTGAPPACSPSKVVGDAGERAARLQAQADVPAPKKGFRAAAKRKLVQVFALACLFTGGASPHEAHASADGVIYQGEQIHYQVAQPRPARVFALRQSPILFA